MRYIAVFLTTGFLSLLAVAQRIPTLPNIGSTSGAGPEVVTGAPYSAEEVTEIVLANGTHFASDAASCPPGTSVKRGDCIVETDLTVKIYRDSQGRTRRESRMPLPPSGKSSAGEFETLISISDPVAHVNYMLDTVRKIAYRQQQSDGQPCGVRARSSFTPVNGSSAASPPPPAAPPPPAGPSMANGLGALYERLGTKLIEGVLCEGRRTTSPMPGGSTLNKDGPNSIVYEAWTSTELHLPLLVKSKNPHTGEQTRRLTNVSRAEPAAELFRPPPDYEVVDRPQLAAPPCVGVAQLSPRGPGVYQIGGEVSAPTLVSKTDPEYPEQARQAKYSGTVLLSVVVNENGVPGDIRVVRPLGLGLDQKAIEAVSKWRFRPGMKAGRAVAVEVRISVSFQLK